jgi:hypothetical protein
MKTRLYLKLPIACAILVVGAATLNAQATRTWVSGVGDDANPCSRTAPCKTFAGAISKTATGGEINVLDPGGFGAVTITKSITISSESFEAGVLVSGTNGIVISAPAGSKVILKGLDFEGLGTGINGVNFLTGSELYIFNCSIRNFTNNGVNAASTTAGAHTFINNSFIQDNGSASASFGGVGAGAGNIVSFTNTSLLSNLHFAAQANGAGAIIGAETSVFNNSPTSVSKLAGGTLVCVGPSNLFSAPTTCDTTVNFQ